MPCFDPETRDRPERLEKKVHKLTALLCWLCDHASDGVIAGNPELAGWLAEHRTHDARVAALKERRNRLGEDSLTPEERGFLWYADDVSV